MKASLTIFRMQHSHRFKWLRDAMHHLKFGLACAICLVAVLAVIHLIQMQQRAAQEHAELVRCHATAQTVAQTINALRQDRVKWGIMCAK